MKKTRLLIVMGIVVCTLIIAVTLAAPARAASQAIAVEGVGFNVAATLKDNLKAFAGKDVYVNLRSGKTYQGVVKSVGDHFVHLERLAGKEFFDALFRIDDIVAIEARFREPK